jgi:hypothetical protein
MFSGNTVNESNPSVKKDNNKMALNGNSEKYIRKGNVFFIKSVILNFRKNTVQFTE